LKWKERKKIREIADIMGISTTMVDKHLAKGMEIVRHKMKPEMLLVFYFMFLNY
jgi:DNA-directed RNA polymerase specialized sigma24 family protein